MSDNATTTGIAAALAAIVAAFVWLVKRKGKDEESPADEIARNIALIEREGMDLPRNWRDYVDARIEHKLNNRRAVLYAVIGLLERGHHERGLQLLREEAENLKQ